MKAQLERHNACRTRIVNIDSIYREPAGAADATDRKFSSMSNVHFLCSIMTSRLTTPEGWIAADCATLTAVILPMKTLVLDSCTCIFISLMFHPSCKSQLLEASRIFCALLFVCRKCACPLLVKLNNQIAHDCRSRLKIILRSQSNPNTSTLDAMEKGILGLLSPKP